MTPLRLAFAGTPDFAARHLAALLRSEHRMLAVLTQPDRPGARGRQPRPGPVKTRALEAGVPVLQPPSLRDPTALEALAALDLDVLVVVAYGLILPQTVLDLPRHGCINVHGSLLPRWRGAAPVQRAIEAGDDESGVTIMRMEAGLDTGPMLARSRCAIDPSMTGGDLFARLTELAPPLLLRVLEDLPAYLAAAEVQDDAMATHAAKISKAEAQIDWRLPAARIAARVHAFNPAPGCWSQLAGRRIKIWRAGAMAGPAAAPGTLASDRAGELAVHCGEGLLRIDELQLPGARALPAPEVLRGHAQHLRPGQRFDGAD